jgi:hypothetical protein
MYTKPFYIGTYRLRVQIANVKCCIYLAERIFLTVCHLISDNAIYTESRPGKSALHFFGLKQKKVIFLT